MIVQPVGRTEPDLDVIKQVEQVTTLISEEPARDLPGSEHMDPRKR
jgi:hypothetical protein